MTMTIKLNYGACYTGAVTRAFIKINLLNDMNYVSNFTDTYEQEATHIMSSEVRVDNHTRDIKYNQTTWKPRNQKQENIAS
jgi:hypothetical protein